MSNITSISSGKNWHLYQVDSDSNNIYLEITISTFDLPRDENISMVAPISMTIPISIWREMVNDWNDSEWGKNPDLDNTNVLKKIKEIFSKKSET